MVARQVKLCTSLSTRRRGTTSAARMVRQQRARSEQLRPGLACLGARAAQAARMPCLPRSGVPNPAIRAVPVPRLFAQVLAGMVHLMSITRLPFDNSMHPGVAESPFSHTQSPERIPVHSTNRRRPWRSTMVLETTPHIGPTGAVLGCPRDILLRCHKFGPCCIR